MPKKAKKEASGRSARSAARLAAVQAIYQQAINAGASSDDLIEEFRSHRLGKIVDGTLMAEADQEFFAELVAGVTTKRDDLDARIAGALSEKWPQNRLEELLNAILRAGCYELVACTETPIAVVINEYLDVAHAFYEGKEVGFVNGVLDQIARHARS